MPLVVELGTLGQETLAAFLATATEDVPTGLGGHAGAESMLALAGTLRGLESAFHDWLTIGVSGRPAARARTLGKALPLSIRQFERIPGISGICREKSVLPWLSPARLSAVNESFSSSAAPSGVFCTDSPKVESATIEDLDALVELTTSLFSGSDDFTPDAEAQRRGLALILEQPSRGRIFVLRNGDRIFGMVNLLFTISTAMGGFVIQMEDVIVLPDHRGQGYGTQLLEHVVEFAHQKDFKRITLLTDKISAESQNFFRKHGFEYSNMIPMRRITLPD